MESPVEVCSATSGTFYIVIATWWWLQASKRFMHSRQRRIEYTGTVTYPCCYSCRKVPLEGAFKLTSCIALASIGGYYAVYSDGGKDRLCSKDRGIAQLTVFVVFGVSAVCDMVAHWCHRFLFPSLDYFLLVAAFAVQCVVSATDTDEDLTRSVIAVGNNLTMLSAACTAVFVLLEFAHQKQVWFALLRSYLTFVLGTWLWQMSYMLNQLTEPTRYDQNITSLANQTSVDAAAESPDQSAVSLVEMKDVLPVVTEATDHLLTVPMYYTWHCAVDFILLLGLWIVTARLTRSNRCLCVPHDDESGSRFENRVHFDYHILDRLDSDID